jgi:ribonuclease J
VEVAHQLGYMPEVHDVLVDIRDMKSMAPSEVVLLTTGSQGEPAAALSRIAADDHRDVKIMTGDTVIFSATPIPGNEMSVSRTINNLYRRGAEVVIRRRGTDTEHIHDSGNGSKEDIRDMLRYERPQYCLPLHGEYRMLVEFKRLAKEMGIDEDHVIITDIGDVVEFTETGGRKAGNVPSGSVLVDGLTLGVDHAVLRDRHRLAAEGVMVVTMTLDSESGRLLAGPDFITRGLFNEDEEIRERLLHDAANRVVRALGRIHGRPDHGVIVAKTREVLEGFIYHHTHRTPMVLPIVSEF